jgi:hypothetical protein
MNSFLWVPVIGVSENRFADTNGDGLPEGAIGRLPVSTAAEAQAMADTTVHHSAMVAVGKEGPVHVMAVDNQRPADASFCNLALEIRKHLPSRTRLIWADVGVNYDTARKNLLQTATK